MSDVDKITSPEKENVPVPEHIPPQKSEQEPVLKTEEIAPEERMLAKQMRKEIEAMEVDPELKELAEKKAEEIKFLDERTKIEYILEIARDALVQEGRYKNRVK